MEWGVWFLNISSVFPMVEKNREQMIVTGKLRNYFFFLPLFLVFAKLFLFYFLLLYVWKKECKLTFYRNVLLSFWCFATVAWHAFSTTLFANNNTYVHYDNVYVVTINVSIFHISLFAQLISTFVRVLLINWRIISSEHEPRLFIMQNNKNHVPTVRRYGCPEVR